MLRPGLRLINIHQLVMLTVILLGCSGKPVRDDQATDIAIRHHFTELALRHNYRLIGRLESWLRESEQETQRIGSMHKSYLREKSRESLLEFSDSIYNLLQHAQFRNDSISEELKSARERVQSDGDSVDVLDLFFWSLTAENIIVEDRLSGISSIKDTFFLTLSSYLEKKQFKVGDTVMVSFEYYPEYKLSFERITCTHDSTKQNLPFRMLKVGPAYIMHLQPTTPGNYSIKGTVGVGGDFDYGMLVSNHFEVL